MNADHEAVLLGQSGSRARLTTPALILDLDALEANVATMAAYSHQTGLGLRPHAKTHKSPDIAQLQVKAGALGITCATLGEAEAMVEAGIAGVLVSSPMVTAAKVERVARIAARAEGFMIIVDDAGNAEAQAAAARAVGANLGLVIDIEVGCERSGVVSIDEACALARRIAATEGVRFAGIQAYDGSVQAIPSYQERQGSLTAGHGYLRALKERLAALGLPPPIVSGGGTGSHDIDRASGVFTEVQAGSYVVLDAIYHAGHLWHDRTHPFVPALFVATTVTSASHPGFVTTDAGLKAFATDSGPPILWRGVPADATYSFMGDEHGRITTADPADKPAPGTVVECLTPHCDPTINLYDRYACVRGDRVVDFWRIARGRW
ncbi:MAG: DSD1 family PLP-dependent enzyme [Alphaproteobacteria bacterium]|nr:DSD1 family PLP-dependent enzyme [Alphaproteobacteria bacterium]